MGEFLSVVIFLVTIWCLGYSISRLLKPEEDLFKQNILRLGLGLGLFAVLSIIFGYLAIPLDWKIFLLISVLGAATLKIIDIVKDKEDSAFKFSLKFKKKHIVYLIVLILFLVSFYMYYHGATIYKHLEDDDPWDHAMGAKYISLQKNINDPGLAQGYPYGYFFYVNPYPPAYDTLMGVTLQTNGSVQFTLKFFNALLISFSILFFFLLAENIFKNKNKALLATFILFAIPSFMSHFIWALSLVVPIGIILLYLVTRDDIDNFKSTIPIMILIGAMFFTQPSGPIKIMLLVAAVWLSVWIYSKKFPKYLTYAIIGGLIIASIWWIPHAQGFVSTTSSDYVSAEGLNVSQTNFIQKVQTYFKSNSGSATRPYTFDDFFVAKSANMINNPIGWGIFITIFTIIGFLLLLFSFKKWKKPENNWILYVLLWFIAMFMIVNSDTFGTPGFYSFRTWLLLAIPVSILCAFGIWETSEFIKSKGKLFKLKIPIIVTILVVLVLIFFTSFIPKYQVNTAFWGPGGAFQANEELAGYYWLTTLPQNTRVFGMCPDNSAGLPSFQDEKTIGFDAMSCGWCRDVINYRETAFNQSLDNFSAWLKSKDYKYVTVDTQCITDYGVNATNEKLKEMAADMNQFSLAYRTQAFFAFSVN